MASGDDGVGLDDTEVGEEIWFYGGVKDSCMSGHEGLVLVRPWSIRCMEEALTEVKI